LEATSLLDRSSEAASVEPIAPEEEVAVVVVAVVDATPVDAVAEDKQQLLKRK